jgi:ABC-type multidrug transport system fused ATPase/permease subunit
MAPGGILRGKDRSLVLVTTNPVLLAQCDQILVLKDGTVAGCGTYQDLVSAGVLDLNTIEGTANEVEVPSVKAVPEKAKFGRSVAISSHNQKSSGHRMMREVRGALQVESMFCESAQPAYHDDEQEEENVIDGKSTDASFGGDEALIAGVNVQPRSSIGALLYALGWWRACVGGLLIVASQAAVYTWQFLLKQWLDGTTTVEVFTHNAQVLRYMIIPMTIPAVLGAMIHYTGFLTGSTRLQAMCSSAVLAAPYSFFSVNPASRVFGHISQDSQQVEQPLSMTLGGMWLLCAQLVGSIVITCISLWYLIFLFLPLAVVYYYIQRQYSKAVVPMSNLDAGARGPVNTAIAVTLAGLPVVRAFKMEPQLERQLSVALRKAGAMSSVVIGCAGWLSFLANVVIFGTIAIVVAVLMALVMDPGPNSLGPLVLSNIMGLSGIIGSTAVLLSNVETSFTALQRLVQYAELPNEEKVVRGGPPDSYDGSVDAKIKADTSAVFGADIERQIAHKVAKKVAADTPLKSSQVALVEPPAGWPAQGRIEYRNASAAYVWGTLPALKNVNIIIPAGSSCALVGRSGSGKSTAFLALTGMIPIISGTIEIDGVACDKVALDRLRAALAVVPQDPVLFSGGLRSNLDPEKKHSDADLWNAVKVVGLENAVQEAGGLEVDPVASGLSQGQRQLLCLARALLRDTVLLLLDEANASLDLESEIILAETVKKFASGEVGAVGNPRKRTVVEVAHRLRTVVEMDQVVVLSAGEVIENGVPVELAKKEGSVFQGMLKAQGLA